MSCPRCHGPMIANIDGPSCFYCGYVDYTNGRSFAETLELIAEVPNRAAPRFPALTRLEAYEDEAGEAKRRKHFIATMQAKKLKQSQEDILLFNGAAQRIGAKVDDLCGHGKAYTPLRRMVATDLKAQGLSFQRIADLMEKNARAVQYWLET